jgi:hypothetical protein
MRRGRLAGVVEAPPAAARLAPAALNVRLALLDKLGTDALSIGVKSVGGTVRLAGTIDRQKAKDRAGTIVMNTRGVSRVENGIRLGAAVVSAEQAGAPAGAGASEADVKNAVLETRLSLALIEKERRLPGRH